VPELYREGQSYDTVDGLHPSAEGMRQMAEHIFSQL
jgi:lysophospholipase L1-like esterase